MECESLVAASLINNANSCREVFKIGNTNTVRHDDHHELSTIDSDSLKSSYTCATNTRKGLKTPEMTSTQLERLRFTRTRSHSSPGMIEGNGSSNKINAFANEKKIKNSNRRNDVGRLYSRHVSFDECVQVLTKCCVIEIPLKSSMLEYNQRESGSECRKSILKHGERIEMKRVSFGQEELMRSAIFNHDLSEFVDMCQQWEGKCNKKMSNGLTPLHLASIAGNYRIVQYLLNNGGMVDEFDDHGWTSLHYAVLHGHIPCTLLLLQAGADVRATTDDHRTAIELASEDEMLLLLGRAMNGVLGRTSLDQNKETYV